MDKTCVKCKVVKDTEDDTFRMRTLPSGRLWENTTCRECERKANRAYHKDGRRNKEKKAAYMRQWTQDNKERLAKKGRERYERLLKENPSFSREANLRSTLKKYGMTEDDYYILLEEQDGRCDICKTFPGDTLGVDRNRLVIDHDHTTGKVRALLCDFCNRGIGMFYDNPDLLVAAAEYVRRHEGLGDQECHGSVI
jgi:hypothetical protein